MQELRFIGDLVLAWTAALLGGAVAQRLKQPVILGYLLAGMLIGPYTPGPVGNVEQVNLFAQIGVLFLMFALGVEFSLEKLKRVQRVAVFGGALQILLTVGLGVLVWWLVGLGPSEGIFFGAIIAISSTTVAIKILLSRGELESPHGMIAMGISLVQDLSLVPMMVILPTLAEPLSKVPLALSLAGGKAAILLVGTYLLGTRFVPWILAKIVLTRSRELFLLTIVILALGTALAASGFGISVALGAFLAGLVVSESELSHQILAEILPLRDIFASLFFVSIGMLMDPRFLFGNAPMILLMVAVIILAKFVLCTMIPLLFGYPGKAAIATGLALAQIGEFSFILARMGLERGLISDYLYVLTLSGTMVTILLSPLLFPLGPSILRGLRGIPLISRLFRDRMRDLGEDEIPELFNHTVICGFGRVGRELALALHQQGLPYLVIEYDPMVAGEARRLGVPCIYGDASNPAILDRAHVERAKVLAVTIPDAPASELTIQYGSQLNPFLDTIARTHSAAAVKRLRNAGAVEVVYPEFEAGMEFVRHTLHRFGVEGPELEHLIDQRRASYHPQEPSQE